MENSAAMGTSDLEGHFSIEGKDAIKKAHKILLFLLLHLFS